MTIQHLFPTAKPTLDLNFAGERSLDPRITFSRSSIGTYVNEDGIIRTAAEDEPRFDHDPLTGESLGLLIEESKTNVITYSFDLGNTGTGGWHTDANKGGLNQAATSNYFVTQSNTTDTLAPDGTYTATKLSAPSTIIDLQTNPSIGEYQSAIHLVSKVSTGPGVSSFYIKDPSNFANGLDKIGIMSGSKFEPVKGYASFDLVNNQVNTKNSASDAKIEAVGNGWYRISCVTGEGGSWGFNAWNALTSDLYIWGAQKEGGSFLTSYIPTTVSKETRAADNCTIEGANVTDWYNDAEGTFFYERVKQNTVQPQQEFWIYPGPSFSQGNNISTTWYTNPRMVLGINDANVSQTTSSVSKAADKVAFALKANDTVLATGGVLGNVVTSNSLPGPIDNISFRYSNWIKRFTYYPRRLSDEQLEALTL